MVERDVRVPATVGAGGKSHYLGRARNQLWLELTAACNLTRLADLEAAAASPSRPSPASDAAAHLLLDRTQTRAWQSQRPAADQRQSRVLLSAVQQPARSAAIGSSGNDFNEVM
ncbi:MAG: hypothetical protein OXT70_04765 [Chloroflexota bacterium]|nr:hypothetical protein [Chloroflexota bacterium]